MFENSNKEIVKEIADETMKVHRLRNIMACFAIALTAILITLICGAGVSTVRAIIKEQQMNPGPGTNGTAIGGGLKVLDNVREQPEVEWADIARPCMQGTPHNKEFAGNEVKFLGVNDEYYGHHYVDLICGEFPKSANEVLMSDTLAEKTGRKQKPGQKMTLNLVVIKDGSRVEEPVEVTITGFYDNPLRAIENYEELYTTEDFQDIYNPELKDENSKVYTKLSGEAGEASGMELAEILDKLNKTAGGNGIYYIQPSNYTMGYVGGVALLLLIIACGYFLIYNIFYISIVNDIRFMGNMKTIGMTGKQIRAMLGYQIRRLAVVGMALGICAGTGMNIFVLSTLKEIQYTFARFYEKKIGVTLLIAAALALVFVVVTVWLSSRKALSLASKVSPVEASRFRTSGRKKMVFAVVSFALSGILFCVLYTTTLGYDIEYMVDRMNETDFNVRQYHALQSMDSPYEPLDTKFKDKLEGLPFVKESFTYYKPRDLKEKPSDGRYDESRARISYSGLFKEVMDKEFGELGQTSADYINSPVGDFETGVLGMPAEALMTEAEQLNIISGSLDAEKFATGDYLIYQPFSVSGTNEDYQYDYLKAGDQIPISFYNYESQDYVTKTFTVMAVVALKSENQAGELGSMVQLAVPDKVIREVYGKAADEMISSVHLNTTGSDKKEQQEKLEQLIAENFNPQIQLTSRYKTRAGQEIQKRQNTVIGIFIGIIFGFIGMANIVNTMVTGVLSRKIEFAAMQSIGMTKRQMMSTIFKDGMKMIIIGSVIVIPAGMMIAKAVAASPMFSGFAAGVFVQSVLLVLTAGVLLSVLVAAILTEALNKKAVVERLREAE